MFTNNYRMATRQIPYVIVEAHPDCKRPWVSTHFCVVEETKLHSSILDSLVEFVYDRIGGSECVKSVKDIETFWDEFYSDKYMSMPPWEATAFIDGKWEDMSISNKELFDALIKEYQKSEISNEEEDKKEDEEEEKKEDEEESKEEDLHPNLL